MISITIDNPDVEQILHQTYGNNYNRLVNEFSQFIQMRIIKEDIKTSIQQLEQGKSVNFTDAFKQVKQRYEP
jgi:hypothetical protein